MARHPSFAASFVSLSAIGLAGVAEARPLSLDLGLPAFTCPLLFGDEASLPPPPVVLPELEGPSAATGAPDAIRLRDGRLLHGKILTSVQNGLLFRDAQSQQTIVLPFAEVVDVSHPGAAPPLSPALLDQQRHFFLEAQLRDLQGRYDSLSVWPPVEELLFGVLGVATGLLLYLLEGPAGLIWAAFIGVPGLISLVVGTFELTSVLHREGDLEDQIAAVRAELARARGAEAPTPAPLAPLAFRF
ncbi:MAG: hypothetical protein ACYCWW_01885 [Deltaproteobacteria bacterium]